MIRRWALVCGEKGQPSLMGPVVERLARRGLALAGFVQEPLERDGKREGYTLKRLAREERLPLARETAQAGAGEELFCSYAFRADAFSAARAWLLEDLPSADVLVVDEVSKLESGGKGHADALELALGSGRLVVMRVRADQLFAVVERFGLPDAVASLEGGSDAQLDAFAAAIAQGRHRPHRAGEVDWRERFGQMVRAHRVDPPPSDDAWSTRAARFAKVSGELSAEGLFTVLMPLLQADDVVVDVGAGVGRHAVELARRVKRVVAVEPSAAMRERLSARVSQEGLSNVSIVPEAWPTPLEGPADVCFSSHVLYGIEDPAPFLCAMSAAAARLCALVLGLSPPSSAVDRLWAAVRGGARPRLPGALEAHALLWQLGEAAELRLIPNSERVLAFDDGEEDLAELVARLHLPAGRDSAKAIAAALPRVAQRGPDGRYALGRTGPNALVVWRPRG